MSIIYIVGRVPNMKKPHEWEFCGVFDNYEVAKSKRGPTEFIGPTEMNDPQFGKMTRWPGAHYPNNSNPPILPNGTKIDGTRV